MLPNFVALTLEAFDLGEEDLDRLRPPEGDDASCGG
jgi:hypothetical protein